MPVMIIEEPKVIEKVELIEKKVCSEESQDSESD
jgi:hypothetical protein